MTAALLSPAIAWQQIWACTDRTLTISCEDSEVGVGGDQHGFTAFEVKTP